MIKIVQGVYGHYTGKSVVPKDKHSEPFQLTPEQEKRLVEQGVAVYVDKQPAVNGSPTDKMSIEDMSAKELRDYGKSLGLTFKVGTKNAEMREAISRYLSETEEATEQTPTGVDDESTEDTEPAPSFDPTEAVQ